MHAINDTHLRGPQLGGAVAPVVILHGPLVAMVGLDGLGPGAAGDTGQGRVVTLATRRWRVGAGGSDAVGR